MFSTPSGAAEAFVGLLEVEAADGIHFADAVAVAKSPGGEIVIRQTHDLTTARAAIDGAWLGALVGFVLGGPVGGALAGAAGGALYAKLVDHGLDDVWVKQMAEWIDPDTSVLLMLVNDPGLRADALETLSRLDGTVVTTTFPDYVRRAIEDALGKP